MHCFINRKIKKQLIAIAALAGLALTGTTETFAQAATLRFAPLPMENRETLLKQFRPLAKFLETKLGVAIEFDFSDSYAEIIKKFSAGQIDLAYLGPLSFAWPKLRLYHSEPFRTKVSNPEDSPLVEMNSKQAVLVQNPRLILCSPPRSKPSNLGHI